MATADWKTLKETPPSYDMYLVTESFDSDEATTAYYGQPWAHKPVGFFKMENHKLARINVVAWDFMPAPYRG